MNDAPAARGPVTIFHDPARVASRDALALIRNSGVEPWIVEIGASPPSRDDFADLVRRMDLPLRALLRREHPLHDALGLGAPGWSDGALLEVMLRHPALIACPIVETPLGVRLALPPESVLCVLPGPQAGAFRCEDGRPVIDARGRRVDRAALD